MTDKEKIKKLLEIIQEICFDIRFVHGDDSVCGLCEYAAGAFITESGDWFNECPGFESEECFCLRNDFKNKYLDD